MTGSEVARERRLRYRLKVLRVTSKPGDLLRCFPKRALRAKELPVACIAKEGVDDGRLEGRARAGSLSDRERRLGRE